MPYTPPPFSTTFANPTASVGLTAVDGTALTAMRSDAAPALASTITAAGPIGSSSQVPVITFNAAGQLTTVTTASISIPVSANPSVTVGLTAKNGTALTFMTSDSAPALDQTATFAFTGLGATTINQAGTATNLTISGSTFGTASTNNLLNLSGTWAVGAGNKAGTALLLNITNTSSLNSSLLADFQIGGVSQAAISRIGNLNLNGNVTANSWVGSGSIRAGDTSQIGWLSSRTFLASAADGSLTVSNNAGTNNFILTAPNALATPILQLGAANALAPINQTLQTQGSRAGTDTNVAGAKFSINPGAGTGNATPNPLQLNSYVAVGSGSTVQTLTNTLTLNSGLLQFNQYTTAGLLQNDVSGNVTTNTAVNASTIPANFIAADRLTIVIAGTTYYIPLATIAF